MAGYSARQSSFTTGDTIEAADSNDEFNQILAAFHVSTGHTHDGTTAGDGGPLSTLYSNAISVGTGADTDIVLTFNANTSDGVITWMEDEDYFKFSDDILVNSTEKLQFRDTAIYLYSSADGQLDLVADTEIQIAATTIDMNGNVDVSGTLSWGSLSDGSVTITDIADEDNMSSNSATKLATQQSIKAYVDTAITAEDLDVTSDSGTIAIDLDSETLTIAGGTGLASSATSNTVTLAIDSTVTTLTGSQTLTNKTLTSPVLNTGVSGTAILDEDNLASDSATQLATQQSIKAYVDAVSTGITTFVMEDDDGTEVTISNNKEIKYIGSGLTTNWTDTDNGTDGDPYDLTFTVDAAQTGITSILATDLKIGEDNETKIDFETANEIHFYANNTEQVYLADNIFGPQSDSDVDLGTTGVRWKDAYVDSVTVTDDVTVGGDLTVNGTTTTVNSTTVTIDDPIFTLGGDSAPGSDDNKDRGIEFRWHNGSAAKVGFFGYDDSASVFTFIPDASNSSEVFSGTVGNVAFGNIAGTLTTAAQTNITSVGALDGGSITSGFGTIDTGSSNITTTGLISGGSLDIDDVLINGTTIGHTDDTDLMTLSNGGLVVAGTLEATGNITGTLATAAQTNITSTGALDGGSITSGFGAIDNGTSGIRTNTFTAETSVVPDASGGADLGSTSLEWGDLYIADDKKIYLGSDQNLSIEYDEDGNDTTALVAAGGLSFAPHGSSAGNGTELRFQELAANGANYVGFKAPDAIAANKVFILPNADGDANQVLKTDGSLALGWVDQAGGGTVSRVADGSIAAQKPVILTSAGKAAQVASSGAAVTEALGSVQYFDSGTQSYYNFRIDSTMLAGDKFLNVYNEGTNQYPSARIGQVGTDRTITWGTEVVLSSNAQRMSSKAVVHDTDNDRIGIFVEDYTSGTNPYKLFGATATYSGTTLTVGTFTDIGDIDSGNPARVYGRYDPDNEKVVVVVEGDTVTNTITAMQVDISGSTPSVDHQTALTSGANFRMDGQTNKFVYDTNVDRFVYLYEDEDDSDQLKSRVLANSGSAFTWGSANDISADDPMVTYAVDFDSDNNKLVAVFATSNTSMSYSVGTVTGGTTNTISWTSPAVIDTMKERVRGNLFYNATAKKFITVMNTLGASSDTSKLYTATLSGSTLTMGETSYDIETWAAGGHIDSIRTVGVFDSVTNDPVVINFSGQTHANPYYRLKSFVFDTAQTITSNLDNGNYLGVAAASISDTATGTIVVPGGLSEGHSSLTIGNHYFTNGAGTVGLVGDSAGEQYLGRAISATEIQLLENEGYLYGTAEGAVTAGKPVQVDSDGEFSMIAESSTTYSWAQGSSAQISLGTNVSGDIAYNTYTNKVNVVQINSANGVMTSHHGTVNGGTTNTVTWGSTDIRTSVGSGDSIRLSYDPVSYKTFCGFYNGSAAEGFIFTNSSGTTTSAGTSSNFYSSDPYGIDAVNVGEDKWVVLYRGGSDYPKCRVVSASGTTISYGTEVTVNSSAGTGTVTGHLAAMSMSYDTANDKVVVFTKNSSGDLLGFVGTVSGTDISFGSASSNLDGGGSNPQPSPGGQQYLPSQGVHICSYYQVSDTSGSAIAVKVSGTSLVNDSGTAPGSSTTMEFDSQTVMNVASVVAYENTYAVVYSDDSVDINLNTFSLSGTTLTKGTDRTIETTTATNTCAAAFDPDTKRVVVIFKENSDNDIYYQVVALAGTETTTNMATDGESYIGIATKTVADNAQVEVATFGQIDAQQSGLTAGQKYFVQSDGSLATSADTSVPGYSGTVTTVAGKALSATKLLISE